MQRSRHLPRATREPKRSLQLCHSARGSMAGGAVGYQLRQPGQWHSSRYPRPDRVYITLFHAPYHHIPLPVSSYPSLFLCNELLYEFDFHFFLTCFICFSIFLTQVVSMFNTSNSWIRWGLYGMLPTKALRSFSELWAFIDKRMDMLSFLLIILFLPI